MSEHRLAITHDYGLEYPISWNWVAGFFDGEATFRAYYEREHKWLHFHSHITLPQKERAILERIRQFVNDELRIELRIYWDKSGAVWRMFCSGFEDVYRLAHKLYPHLHHPKRREAALDVMNSIIRHAQMMIPIERRRHRIRAAERYEGILRLAERLPIHIYA